MSDRLVSWRVMCFEADGDRLLSVTDLGDAGLEEIRSAIMPSDNHEMCGSYPLTGKMIEWLCQRFGKELPDPSGCELFLERES